MIRKLSAIMIISITLMGGCSYMGKGNMSRPHENVSAVETEGRGPSICDDNRIRMHVGRMACCK